MNILEELIGAELFSAVINRVPQSSLTEVRIRRDKPVSARNRAERIVLNKIADAKLIDEIVARATNYSLYAYQEEIASGYIHCKGGIRLGLAGRGVSESGKIIAFKDISSLNIRIPHEIIGCSDALSGIMKEFKNTVIIAPPFAGKTTLIRDMARVLSDRYDVAIIDEREEIAGRGAGYKFGRFCDVVSGVPKNLAYEGIIRALSPEIIILDELSPAKDLAAVQDISRSGVSFLASFHGDGIDYFVNSFKELSRLFTYGVLLSYKPTVGSIKSIVRFKVD